MVLIFEVFCAALAYSAFCRAVHLDRSVLLRLRFAVTAVGATAMYGMYLPFSGWVPDHVHVVFVGSTWAYLTAFSKTWPRSGPPHHMKRTNLT